MFWLKTFFVGFLIGLANLIPGVSGGTFALILGVYERLIAFLNNINISSIAALLSALLAWFASGFSRDAGCRLARELKERDYPFIAMLGCGSLVCILSLSAVMKYLLTHQFSATYGYFFGLIVLSVLIPWRMVKRMRPMLILPLIAGIGLTIWVTASVNPYEKTLAKSELLKDQYQIQTDTRQVATEETDTKFRYIGKYSTTEYLYIIFCGMVAISAMVLPGISGSLVLILMNQYFTVISAIANLSNLLLDDMLYLGAMAVGIAIGLISFARVIDFGLKRYHDPMISFLIGLIIGSLWALWPFKQVEVIADYYVKEGALIERLENVVVYTNINVWPQEMTTALVAGTMVIVGLITMVPFIRSEKQ